VPKILENALAIYTDGSLQWKGRKGGYGLVFVHFDAVGNETTVDTWAPPGIIGTTGNRMELQAVVTALKMAPDCSCYSMVNKVVIRTDSLYVEGNHKRAVFEWSRNNWCKRDGQAVDNADLWKEFVRLFRAAGKRTELEKVKAHQKGKAKDVYNDAADKLAKASRDNPLRRREFLSSVRRKIGTRRTKRGSIEPQGQTLIVYVVETKRMRIQKVWKYRCEVISDGPWLDAIDWLQSAEQLRDGHFYEVVLNDNPKNPTITTLLREVLCEPI
jgi:ribonuclease HI